MVQRDAQGRRLCGAKARHGGACRAKAVRGAVRCRKHLGGPQARANAAVRAEVSAWTLGDETVDPAETLLKLVSQSAARVRRYSELLEKAYDAADRLREALHHDALLLKPRPELQFSADGDPVKGSDHESAHVQAARADLDHVFNAGGVAALVGLTYAAASGTGEVFPTGEAIRGLAKLEADERDRCARFSKIAIDAGIAKREVELAERQGQMLEQVMLAVLEQLGLTDEQIDQVPDLIEAKVAQLTLVG